MEERSFDIHAIMQYLPHRYPMLMVDRILDYDREARKCRGLKNVTINEPFFQGHYPEKPVMPGVMIIEAIAQVGAAVTLMDPQFTGHIPLIGAIDNVKFRRVVIPGDQMIIDVEVLWMRGSIGRMAGKVTVEGEMVTSLEMTFKLRARDR
jgi:3-hydroxyacyl-[acyl-carrier-protein] dehydratase